MEPCPLPALAVRFFGFVSKHDEHICCLDVFSGKGEGFNTNRPCFFFWAVCWKIILFLFCRRCVDLGQQDLLDCHNFFVFVL